MINGWYKRKWKAYTPTDEEARWGIIDWVGLLMLICSISLLFSILLN